MRDCWIVPDEAMLAEPATQPAFCLITLGACSPGQVVVPTGSEAVQLCRLKWRRRWWTSGGQALPRRQTRWVMQRAQLQHCLTGERLPEVSGMARCVQYIFALTEASGTYVAGRLWRSDDYGRAGSWKDITSVLPGAPDVAVAGRGLALTVVDRCSPDTCLMW